jgi:hypothetical protein
VRVRTKTRQITPFRRSKSNREDCKKRGHTCGPVNYKSSKDRKKLNLVTLSTSYNSRQWEVKAMPAKRHLVKGVNLRASSRWITTQRFPTSVVDFPFIDKVGKFTGTTLYRCTLPPAAYISSVIATVYRRLKFFCTRSLTSNSIGDWNKRQNILLRCCAYYSLTKNHYFWDRVLVLTKNISKNYKLISRIVHSFASKLDAHTWFVYGHVCLQTQWLTSRALKPRDKSAVRNKFTFMSPNPHRVRDMGGERRFEYDAVWKAFVKTSQMVS